MKYILRSIIYEGAPEILDDQVTIRQRITISTGVEGDIHDFEKTDVYFATSSMTKTGNEIKQDIINQALGFIQQKYPNTN